MRRPDFVKMGIPKKAMHFWGEAMEGVACQDSLRIIFDGAAEFVMLLDHSGKIHPPSSGATLQHSLICCATWPEKNGVVLVGFDQALAMTQQFFSSRR